MVGYADLRENSTNILERDKISKDSIETWKDVSLRLILENLVGDGKLHVKHFVDPDLEVKIFFEKEGATEEGGCVDFEILHWGNEIVYWGWKNLCRTYLLLHCWFLFFFFGGNKKIASKSSLTRTFIPWLSSYFNISSWLLWKVRKLQWKMFFADPVFLVKLHSWSLRKTESTNICFSVNRKLGVIF